MIFIRSLYRRMCKVISTGMKLPLWNSLALQPLIKASKVRYKVRVLLQWAQRGIYGLIRFLLKAVFTNLATVYTGWFGWPFTHYIHVRQGSRPLQTYLPLTLETRSDAMILGFAARKSQRIHASPQESFQRQNPQLHTQQMTTAMVTHISISVPLSSASAT